MYLLVGLALLALFTFPLIAYGAIWLGTRTEHKQKRPEPSRADTSSRTIPGGKRDQSD